MKTLVQYYRLITSCIAIILIVCLSRCADIPRAKADPMFQSAAEFGWYGNVFVATITDYRGEQFMMQFKLYKRLFEIGGYNKVISFYYTHPYDERIYVVSTTFQVSHAYDADQMSKQFDTSYVYTVEADTLYQPKAQIISKSISVRKQRYRDSYNPSTAKPII